MKTKEEIKQHLIDLVKSKVSTIDIENTGMKTIIDLLLALDIDYMTALGDLENEKQD